MKLEVAGVEYTNFLSASAEIRLDALSNTFSFQAVSSDLTPLPFKGGEPCRVIVNDQAVVTGFIEVVGVNYDDKNHTIAIQGRDKTGDFLDSTISTLSDLRAPITLKQLIEKVIDNIGAKIKVVDQANVDPFNAAEDVAAPEPGQNAFEFVEPYARKRQVLLTSNGAGDIVIAATPGPRSAGVLQNILGASDNNIKAGSVSYDTTGRYNVYKMASALNPIALNNSGVTAIGDVVKQEGEAVDPNVRIGRQMILVAEGPFSSDQDRLRAKWEANVRKTRGRVFSVTVAGYQVGGNVGDLWRANTLVRVRDDFAGIDADMLVNSVTYTLDLSGGQQTTLALVGRNAYTLDLTEPKTEDLGGGFSI